MDLETAWARHLTARALMLEPAPDGEEGYDARDSAGVRYRIAGIRIRRGGATFVVPGVPRRRFDRIVTVVIGANFGITGARMARAEYFLRAARHREDTNDWILAADDEFWSGPEVDDLTVVLRTAAAQEGREEEVPPVKSIASPRRYPAARRDSELRAPEA